MLDELKQMVQEACGNGRCDRVNAMSPTWRVASKDIGVLGVGEASIAGRRERAEV